MNLHRECIGGPFDGHSVSLNKCAVGITLGHSYKRSYVHYATKEDGKLYFERYCPVSKNNDQNTISVKLPNGMFLALDSIR